MISLSVRYRESAPAVVSHERMYILDPKRLLPGDIIFTREKWDPTSIGIRTASFSRCSHAALYVEAYPYIDSDRQGVHANNPQYKLLFPSVKDVAVKRYKEPLSKEVLNTICDFGRSEIGKRYSVPGTLELLLVRTWRIKSSRPTILLAACSHVIRRGRNKSHAQSAPIQTGPITPPSSSRSPRYAERHQMGMLLWHSNTAPA